MRYNVLGAPIKVTRGKPTGAKIKPTTKIKEPFPDLIDPSKRSELIKKYEPYFESFFAASKTSGLLAAATTTFFNDKRVFHKKQEVGISRTLSEPDQAYIDMAEKYSKRAEGDGTFDTKLRITDNNVVLYSRPIELEFEVTIPGPQNKSESQMLTQYMRTLFPAFAVPVGWEYTPSQTPPINFILGANEITTGWKPIDYFQAGIKLDDTSNFSYVPQLEFKGNINSDMSQAAWASLFGIVTLNSLSSYDKYSLGIDGNTPETGGLQIPILAAQAKVTVQTQIRLPMEMALWMTLQTHPDNFNPKVFHEFASEHMAALVGFSLIKPKDIPLQTMTMKDIHESNQARMQEFGLKPKSKVNEDNLMINSEGKIWHVPTVNNTATYDAIQRKAFDPATGELIPDKRIPELSNLPVLTDNVNEVYSYTGFEGKLQFVRLSGGLPLDKTTIAKYLKRSPANLFGVTDPNRTEYESNAADVASNLFGVIQALIDDADRNSLDLIVPNPSGYSQVISMWNYICNATLNEDMADVFTGKTETTSKGLRPMVESFVGTMKNVLGYVDKQKKYGVQTLIGIRFWLILFTKYATNPNEYITHANETLQKNTPVVISELPNEIDIPNFGNGVSVLPHQIQAVEQARKGPQLMILDFSPGGGKTITSIFDILLQKQNGRIGTALVVCPPILVKEWCSEIVKHTKGKVNAIPLTATVVRKLRLRLGINREQFLDYCQKAPPNTIFVTSMKFLTLKSDKFAPDNKSRFDVRYGKTIITQYPQVWFIKQLNPDYIVVDESQWAKSSNAQVTQAIKQISSMANFRRLSSGTIITNVGDDLIGQASVLNPAIYGNKDRFYDKYAITKGKGKKFDGFKPGAERLIRDDAKPYVSWLTKRRADWSFLLPKINTQFWKVDLTPNQNKFYQDLLEQAIEDIKKDKEIKKLLNEGDPNMEDRLEAMMKPYLAKAEIFINAPDSDSLAFNTLSYAEPEDMVGPKVTLCEKMCRAHFNGGTLEGQRIQKSDAKIIIFGYNKEVIEHFKRHFNPGFKTVFYQAGDDTAVQQFRQDPSVKILVAAETSLREGLNLQQCFPAHTQVLTGYETSTTMENIYNDPNVTEVLSYDLKNKRIEKRKILKKLRYKVKEQDEYVRVAVFDPISKETKSLLVTSNHQIFLKGGEEVRADELKPGQKLITYGGKFEHQVRAKTGDLVNKSDLLRFTMKNFKLPCEYCGELLFPGAKQSHYANKHDIGTKKYKELCRSRKALSNKNWSDEAFVAKVKESAKKFWNSKEGKAIHAKIAKERWAKPEERLKASQRLQEIWANRTLEKCDEIGEKISSTLQNISKARSNHMKSIWKDPEYRARHKSIMDKARLNPEYSKVLSKATKEMWSDPEEREFLLEAIKLASNTKRAKRVKSLAMKRVHERPGYTEATMQKALEGQKRFPNKPEKAVINLNISGVKYTGNGAYWTRLEMNGEKAVAKNPDFIIYNERCGSCSSFKNCHNYIGINKENEVCEGFELSKKYRAKKVIEVIGHRAFTDRDYSYDKKLVAAYKKAGIDCLILEASDLYKNPSLKKARSRIESFANNHYLTVVSVKRATKKSEQGKYKYDLTIEGNSNYFACAGSTFEQRNKPLIPVLVHNSDTLIRLQSLWSPGNQEQAVSRVMRPDVGNTYNRSEINYFWVVTDNSMEVAKTCRLISKYMSNLTIMEGDNPEFQEFSRKFDMGNIPIIRMNILKEDSPVRYMNWDDLPQYSNAWGAYLTYEEQQFDSRKKDLRRMVANKLKIPVEQVSDELAKKNAFTPIVSTKMIAGSRSIWTPLARGAVPHDPFGLDLKAIAVLSKPDAEIADDSDEEEEEDDNEDIVDQETISEGDMVYTDVGIGYVKKLMARQVRVDVPGVPFSPLTLNKTEVFKPMNQENAAKVAKMMKAQGSKGLTFMNGFDHFPALMSGSSVKINKLKPSIEMSPIPPKARSQAPEPVVMPDEDDSGKQIQRNKDRLPGRTNQIYPIEIGGGVFDGLASVYFYTDQEHLRKVLKTVPINLRGQYPQFGYRHVKTWQGLKNLIAALENQFNLPQGAMDQLMNAGKKLYHRGNPKLIQRNAINVDFHRFLNVTTHRVSKDPHMIQLFPMIMNGELYVVGSTANQPKQMAAFRKLNVSGLGPYQMHEPMSLICFKNPGRALKYLKELKKHFNVAGIDDVMERMRSAPANFYRL